MGPFHWAWAQGPYKSWDLGTVQEGLLEQRFLGDSSYKLFCGIEDFIIIFMALNIVLKNYFEDNLSLVDQSSDICDEILSCLWLSFNIFLWIIQIDQTFNAYDFGALQEQMVFQTR